jgi:thiamine biosynthesis lipoprotein
MPKMSIEPAQHLIEGRTMGTTWSVRLAEDCGVSQATLQTAFQRAVHQVDMQMSTWSPHSDLMRLNAAPVGDWVPLPNHLMAVLTAGLAISRDTKGAFEMNVGDAVRAWGFGADQINLDAIRAASGCARIPATQTLILDAGNGRAQKTAPLALDLSGIAKGYGVDRLAFVAAGFGIKHALCAIDGEVKAVGTQTCGTPWPVGIEVPDTPDRKMHSVLGLADMAAATSGDYRHFVEVKGTRLSHTIDPHRGAPLVNAPGSVTVLAKSCMQADAMATALMVMGRVEGHTFALENEISALFLTRKAGNVDAIGTGLFVE